VQEAPCGNVDDAGAKVVAGFWPVTAVQLGTIAGRPSPRGSPPGTKTLVPSWLRRARRAYSGDWRR